MVGIKPVGFLYQLLRALGIPVKKGMSEIECNDCVIGDYVSIMSGASVSERAEIGDGCFLAAGSTVYPHKKLGNNAKVEIAVRTKQIIQRQTSKD